MTKAERLTCLLTRSMVNGAARMTKAEDDETLRLRLEVFGPKELTTPELNAARLLLAEHKRAGQGKR